MQYTSIMDLALDKKRVLIREDFNVPMQDGRITSDARIQRALPTIQLAIQSNARVMLMSHLGRPEEGRYDATYSLAPVAEALSCELGQEVRLIQNLQSIDIEPGQVVLYENVRFLPGEKANDPGLAKQMASLCDIFVMDAFATAHRAQASTAGVAEYAPIACAGPLLIAELNALSAALEHPQRPLAAIVGGSKVSTKINLLDCLLNKVDTLIVGGGIANTLLAAAGRAVGQSLYEADQLDYARALLQQAQQANVAIPLPTDIVTAKTFNSTATAETKLIDNIADDDLILDVGPKTIASYTQALASAGTIVWNGPLGVFEWPGFAKGTEALGKAVASSSAYSLAGGGDTVAALAQFELMDKISYVSTGGGAFLEFLQGDTLPVIAILEQRESSVS